MPVHAPAPFAYTRLDHTVVPIFLRDFEIYGLTEKALDGSYVVTLRKGLSETMALDTLIHEFVHCVDIHRELNLECCSEMPEYHGSHRIVQMLGSGLAQMLAEIRVVSTVRGTGGTGSTRGTGSRSKRSTKVRPAAADGISEFLRRYKDVT